MLQLGFLLPVRGLPLGDQIFVVQVGILCQPLLQIFHLSVQFDRIQALDPLLVIFLFGQCYRILWPELLRSSSWSLNLSPEVAPPIHAFKVSNEISLHALNNLSIELIGIQRTKHPRREDPAMESGLLPPHVLVHHLLRRQLVLIHELFSFV